MNFNELLERIESFPIVTDDTRELQVRGVFVAGGGRSQQIHFLEEAIRVGPAVIVTEDSQLKHDSIEIVHVPNRRVASAELAIRFYGNAARRMTTIGITGTCGKTTTTYLLESIFASAGHSVGVIGTQNIRFAGNEFPSPNTTPSPFVLHRTLRDMLTSGCSVVVMEVSSHAIEQDRTHGMCFDGTLFTNLSVEHLDLHGSMEAYYATKRRLFVEYAVNALRAGKVPRAAINHDSNEGGRLFQELKQIGIYSDATLKSFSLNSSADMTSNGLQISVNGIFGQIHTVTDAPSIGVESKLLGQFNAENILGAATLAQIMGIDRTSIEQGIRNLPSVPGRMDLLPLPHGISVVVDYAHKPGAMEVVLQTLRMLCGGRLISVFGCGGQRDQAKRSIMGGISAKYADLTILTEDNNRGENPRDIIKQIMTGIPEHLSSRVHAIIDRRSAISTAIKLAQRNDIILIAGRGAEEVLITNSHGGALNPIPFNDRQVAMEIAKARSANY